MSNAEQCGVMIRRMTSSDIHEVLALDRVVRGWRESVISFGDITAATPGTSPDLSFVAEAGGRIVGFSINRLTSLMVPLTEVCIIHAILVHPDYQGRGIGSDLVRALLDHCEREHIGTVRALIPEDNAELQTLFERHGFRRSRTINFDKSCQS